MNQRDAEVGYLLVGHLLNLGSISALEILAASVKPHFLIPWMQVAPLLQVPDTQIVFIIIQQLLQTGLGNIGQLDLRLAGSGRRLIAFGNVLFTASGGLHHLVYSTVSPAKIVLGEVIGDIIYNSRNLIGLQMAVVAVLREKSGDFRSILNALIILMTLITLRNLITLIFLIHKLSMQYLVHNLRLLLFEGFQLLENVVRGFQRSIFVELAGEGNLKANTAFILWTKIRINE